MEMESTNINKRENKAMKRAEVPTDMKSASLKEKPKKEIFEDTIAENFPSFKKKKLKTTE